MNSDDESAAVGSPLAAAVEKKSKKRKSKGNPRTPKKAKTQIAMDNDVNQEEDEELGEQEPDVEEAQRKHQLEEAMQDIAQFHKDMKELSPTFPKADSFQPDDAPNDETYFRLGESETDPIIIAVYAEKGGVGKTSVSLNLSLTLAALGHRVVVYDLDSQRNLSSWAFGHDIGLPTDEGGHRGNLTSFTDDPDFEGTGQRTFYDQYFFAMRNQSPQVACARRPERFDTLPIWIVPGHRSTLSFDEEITLYERIGGDDRPSQTAYTGAPFHLIRATGRRYGAKFVILDLNPSAGALNRCLISTAHYLITPVNPDFFSCDMMTYFGELLATWAATMHRVHPQTTGSRFPVPPHRVKYLGLVVNRYIPWGTWGSPQDPFHDGLPNESMSRNFQFWDESVMQAARLLRQKLLTLQEQRNVPPHHRITVVAQHIFDVCHRTLKLASVRELYSMRSLSDHFKIPIHFMARRQLVKLSLNEAGEVVQSSMSRDDQRKKLVTIHYFLCLWKVFTKTVYDLIERDREG